MPFVYDNESLMGTKSDARPLTGLANQNVTAAEMNALVAAVVDLRTAILSGEYQGLAENEAEVSTAGHSRIRNFAGQLQASIDGLAYESIRGPGIINVRDYGVIGDGETLCGDAIRAAVAAAQDSEYTKTIYFPPGEYVVDKPILVSGSGIRIVGSGYGTKFVTNNTYRGPVFLYGPDEGDFPRVAGGPFGGGYYYQIPLNGTGNGGEVINLRDSDSLDYNGATGFNASCWFWPESGVAGGTIMGCAGTLFAGASQTISFQLACSTTDDIRGIMNIGGTRREITTFGGNLTEEAWNHLELDYDGSNVRLFVNGVIQGTVAATGTVTQASQETFYVGLSPGGWPERNNVSQGKAGRITGIKIGTASVHTSNFTPPTALPSFASAPSGTVSICNFDEIDGMFLVHESPSAPVYTPIRRDLTAAGFVQDSVLENVRFEVGQSCGAVLARQAIKCTYRDIVIESARYGILMGNNCFNSTVSNLNCTLASGGWCSIGVVIAGEVVIHGNVQLLGGDNGLVVVEASVLVDGAYILGQSSYPIYVSGGSNTNMQFNRCSVSDEGRSAAMTAAIGLYDLQSGTFTACNFEQAQFDVGLVRFQDCSRLTFNNCLFYTRGGGSTPLFNDLDSDPSTSTKVLVNAGRFVNESGHERCNNVGVVTYDTDNQSGTVTISDTDDSADIEFDLSFPTGDTAYFIALGVGAPTGTPASGAYSAHWTVPTEDGFTINLAAAPGSGNSVTVHWSVRR